MSVYVRTCPSAEKFNTGGSYCPIDPSKVKALILATKDLAIPFSATAESIKEMCHADRPNRIYPIKGIVEYAPSGGEAQTETQGYGGMKIIGYSAKDDVFTLGEYDMEIVKNITRVKNATMYVFYVDADNQIHGIAKDDNESIYGVPAKVYVGDQSFDTSSTNANTTLHIALEDVEKFMLNRTAFKPEFDVVDNLIGLLNVRFVLLENNKYKLVDSSNTDITAVYKDLTTNALASATSSFEYESQNEVFTAGTMPTLKTPSELYELGIIGIEQL
jgi:hypothetical protein